MRTKHKILAGLVVSFVMPIWLEAASSLQFSAGSYSVAESAGAVTLIVQRTGDTNTVVTVDYATADLTATNGLKYTAVSGTLTFVAGETNKTIVVLILNDGFVQGAEFFRVILSNPTGGAVLGNYVRPIVQIADNDVGIQFQFASYSEAEDAEAVQIGVVRGDDGNLPVTVSFATDDGTATNGVDYVGTTTMLAFAPQERLKFVSIPIINNSLKQPNRIFNVSLANAAGATLGAQKTATVTIVDNDQGFQLGSVIYTVTEDAGAALIGVLRGTDDTNSTVTVDYATSDGSATNAVDYIGITNTLAFGPGERVKQVAVPILNNGLKQATRSLSLNLSATAGLDYQAVSGTLEFQANETVQSINIPITRNRAAAGGAKTFRVVLSNPTGGATLGTSSTTVSILGSYSTVAPPFDTALNIAEQQGRLNILNWNGGGQLQTADLAIGPWQSLVNAKTPYAVQSPVSSKFYRVKSPRPANLYVPSNYDAKAPLPLVILLHAYGSAGADEESYFQIQPLAESRGFLYCYPDSLIDRWGNPFWNATDASADFGYTGVDDAGYLRDLIDEMGRQFAVDQKRVYLIGHSNGGFMVYRMACQFSSLIAGVASLAGGTFLDPSQCTPAGPVNILHIHGTGDSIVPYSGGVVTTGNPSFTFPWNTPAVPGALRDIQTWATYNGASGAVTDPAPSLDLTTDVTGLDTAITRYTNSPPGGAVELWTITGGSHSPVFSTQFSPLVVDWLLAHPKP